MDNVIKTKYLELKEKFHFNVDIKNIKFYQKIKNTFTQTVFFSSASCISFLFSLWLVHGTTANMAGCFFIALFFFPFFFSFLKKLNLKRPAKFTLLSSKLPKFLRTFKFIKSAEDSFFYSRDKISNMLSDENFQVVFFDFFHMAKQHIYKTEEQRRFTKNIVTFKAFLETKNYDKAADYFIELYGVADQFEYLVHDDYQNSHDYSLLKTRKKIIDEFFEHTELDNFSIQKFKTQSLQLQKELPKNSSKEKEKINWKKLMDE